MDEGVRAGVRPGSVKKEKLGKNIISPFKIEVENDKEICKILAFKNTSLMVDCTGKVYIWGENLIATFVSPNGDS
jgi:alpha-tubulin suppressor-like RCC1 family protein